MSGFLTVSKAKHSSKDVYSAPEKRHPTFIVSMHVQPA